MPLTSHELLRRYRIKIVDVEPLAFSTSLNTAELNKAYSNHLERRWEEKDSCMFDLP